MWRYGFIEHYESHLCAAYSKWLLTEFTQDYVWPYTGCCHLLLVMKQFFKTQLKYTENDCIAKVHIFKKIKNKGKN